MGISIQKTIFCAFCSLMLSIGAQTANSQENYVFDINPNYSSLQGSVIYVPAGTTTKAMLAQTINSQTTTEGSNVFATLSQDFIYNGTLVAGYGSTLNGTVIKANKAGFGNRNGQIQIKFTSIRTPNGYTIPISAGIVTNDGTGILKASTTADSAKDYAKNTVAGAASGAILGTIMGPLSGGKVGKGAVYGTAVGGGLGLINAARQKGEDVTIPANAVIDIYFDQPVTISAPRGY